MLRMVGLLCSASARSRARSLLRLAAEPPLASVARPRRPGVDNEGGKLVPDCHRFVGVTAPRQILPGCTYLITRRCTQRQFLLTPSNRTNRNVEYCLALAAERTGVLLHAVCVMSNHWHGVVTDPDARLPQFLEVFHKLLAKAQNASFERCENLWSSDKTSMVLLVSEQDVLDKMAYTLANPTAAGLVRAPSEWPGVMSRDFRECREIEMPDMFFDEDGELPDSVTLEFTRPPILRSLSDVDLRSALAQKVADLVRRAREEMLANGKSFLGREAILRQSFGSAPATKPAGTAINPRVACKSPSLRVAAISRLQLFLRAYRTALLQWRGGDREVMFPAGTYAKRVFDYVRCVAHAPGFV